MSETHEIDGVTLHLAAPITLDMQWVGRPELMLQVLAAWLQTADEDFPLSPRLVGKPGVGKTTLAYAAGRTLGKEVYFFQATMDTRPEDLIVTPVVAEAGALRYSASPLVTAMIRGGVVVLDEGNRMSEKSWASLAPLLDRRRYVESLVAGIQIQAHPDFRFCATMNDDASTFDLPEYIHSRLQPQILIDFPEPDEERLILRYNLPFAPEEVLEYVVAFLRAAHHAGEPYTVRDGINVARYALKLAKQADDLRADKEGAAVEAEAGAGTDATAQASAQTAAQTSAQTAAQTSAQASAQTPAQASAQTSAQTPAQASAQTSAQTPAQASAQASAQAPAQADIKAASAGDDESDARAKSKTKPRAQSRGKKGPRSLAGGAERWDVDEAVRPLLRQAVRMILGPDAAAYLPD